MGIIDEAQNLALEIVGLFLIVGGGIGWILDVYLHFTQGSALSSPIPFIAMIVAGSICAGYRAIPRRLIELIRAIKGK